MIIKNNLIYYFKYTFSFESTLKYHILHGFDQIIILTGLFFYLLVLTFHHVFHLVEFLRDVVEDCISLVEIGLCGFSHKLLRIFLFCWSFWFFEGFEEIVVYGVLFGFFSNNLKQLLLGRRLFLRLLWWQYLRRDLSLNDFLRLSFLIDFRSFPGLFGLDLFLQLLPLNISLLLVDFELVRVVVSKVYSVAFDETESEDAA